MIFSPDIEEKREEMVEFQLARRGIRDKAVLAAAGRVPRDRFVAPELVEFAYEDTPLPIEEQQTISQPYIVALMAELLGLGPEDRVLEIGTGSGYAAAVMAEIAAEVFTIERHESLALSARNRLRELGYDNVHVRHGDGTRGWPEEAPFDGIIVAAGGPSIPEPLREQLAVGGRLVIPVGRALRGQELVLLTRTGEGEEDYHRENLGPVRFVPLIGEMGWVDKQGKQQPAVLPRPAATLPDKIAAAAEPFAAGDEAPLDDLLARIGDARVVLLGEASHGTEEFYDLRARITRALVEEKGFNVVAVEADWPDAAVLDRYVRDTAEPAVPAGRPFTRFPTWMWANTRVLSFLRWLREHNRAREKAEGDVGFYGLDLYSLQSSIAAVLDYLEEVDPEAAAVARQRYGCLSPWEQDPAAYGAAALSGRYQSCETEVVAMLRDLLDKRLRYTPFDGRRFLDALQNARLVADAEKYYRIMYYGGPASWNLRDRHMFDTLRFVLNFRGPEAKGVVWAHNSHLGDARATEMGRVRQQLNVGQLAREKYGEEAYLIGFGTDHGTVAAADEWGGEMKVKKVRPSHERSYERLCHDSGVANFFLPLRGAAEELRTDLAEERLERAIGVIYRSETELQSHYFFAELPAQFDEYIWFDETRAVTPLTTEPAEALPDTYPFGV